jgi:hypothetical protein
MSNCAWDNYEEPDANGNRRVYCINCGYVTRTSMAWEFSKIYRACPGAPIEQRSPATNEGPGTELNKIFDSLGIKPKESCQCKTRMAEMNCRGVQGCIDTRDEILGWLREAYDESSLSERAIAGMKAVALGLPLTLAGLLDLAIARAEEKEASRQV